MWVIVEKNEDKKDRSVELQYFNRISIKMIKYIIKSKREGKNKMCEMSRIFKTIYILIYSLMIILIALFIYTCISFNNYNECRKIDFQSKSCEKWRNY